MPTNFVISESNPSKAPPGSLINEQITELCFDSARLMNTKKTMKIKSRITSKTVENVIQQVGLLLVDKILQQQWRM